LKILPTAGNDLSHVLSSVWPELRSTAQSVLDSTNSSGWEAVFGGLEDVSKSERVARATVLAAAVQRHQAMAGMTGTCFQQEPALLEDVGSAIAADQPDLCATGVDGVVQVRGSYAVRDGGVFLDRYQIEIRVPRDYPKNVPVVEEIGGRIPRTADRHISADGTACLLVPEEWLLAGDQSFKAFLNGPMKNFFLGQILVEAGKPWPFGQRSHGYEGLIEA
jgi:hypothetical protein